MNEIQLDALAEHIRRNDLVVLAGAGISFAPPSCAPLFRQLRDDLLRAFTISLKGYIPEDIEQTCQQLFHTADSPRGPNEPVPEVLFEALDNVLDLCHLLRIQLLGGYPNAQHRFIAGLLGRGIRLLITTNFDNYFEQALINLNRQSLVCSDGKSIRASVGSYHQPGKLAPIWKPHGTLEVGQEETIKVTLSQVARESYDSDKQQSLVDIFKHHPILVIGYSGYDHDIAPIFKQASANGPGLYWLSYTEPKPSDPCLSILHPWNDRGHLMVGDISELFSCLASRLGHKESIFIGASADCNTVYRQRDLKLSVAISQLPLASRLFAIVVLSYRLTQPAVALALIPELIAQIKAEYNKGKQQALMQLVYILEANIFKELNRYDDLARSIINLERVIDPRNLDGVAVLRQFQGELALGKGEFLRARKCYKEALKAASDSNSTAMEATVLQSMAVLYAQNEQWEQARQCLDRVLEISGEQGRRIKSLKALHELGISAIESNQIDEAETYFEMVIRQSQDLGHADLIRAALYEQAIIAKRRKEYGRAQNLLDRSFKLAYDLENEHAKERCLLMSANLVYEQGMDERNEDLLTIAVEKYTGVINHARAIQIADVEANALAGRGRIHALLGNKTGLLHDLFAMKQLLDKWPVPFVAREIAVLEKLARMMGLDNELMEER